MTVQKQKDSILKAIEALYNMELANEGEKERHRELSAIVNGDDNSLDIYDTQELRSVDTEVYSLAYKYDYEKEIDQIICSWVAD